MEFIYSNLVITGKTKKRSYIAIDPKQRRQLGGQEREIKMIIVEDDDFLLGNHALKTKIGIATRKMLKIQEKLKESEELMEVLMNEDLDKILGCKVANEQNDANSNPKRD